MSRPLTIGWKSGCEPAVRSHDFEVRTVYDVFDVVRKKPGVFLGEPNVHLLQSFVSGFDLALAASGNPLAEESPPFSEFHDWVASRLGLPESTVGWPRMLSSVEETPETAFNRFYDELSQFRAAGGMNGSVPTTKG